MWEMITAAMAHLEPAALDASTADLQEIAAAAAAAAAAGTDAPAAAAGDAAGLPSGGDNDDNEELVEYEGMLVSAAAAQRRRFFSSLIQRAAKMHRRLRGGSMTMLLVTPGTPASGECGADHCSSNTTTVGIHHRRICSCPHSPYICWLFCGLMLQARLGRLKRRLRPTST